MSVCRDPYLLQSYVDGQLGESEAQSVVEHLRQCPSCASLVQGLKAVALPLRADLEPCPEGLRGRLELAVQGLHPLPAIGHRQALEWLSLQADGELTHSQTQRLQAHLDACADCARAALLTEVTSAALRSAEPEMAPEGLLLRIQAATGAASDRRRRRVPAWQQWGLGVAAAAAALIVVLISGLQQPPPVGSAVALAPPPAPTPIESATLAPRPAPPPAPATVRPGITPTVATPHRAARAERPAPARWTAAVTEMARPERVAVRQPAPPAPEAPIVQPLIPHPDGGRPVVVALASVAPAGIAVRPELPAAPAVPAEAAPAAPEKPLADAPTAARVARLETGKSAPAPEIIASPAAETPRRTRSSWVSRSEEPEVEIYRSNDITPRLAMARRELNDHISDMRSSEIRGIVIH